MFFNRDLSWLSFNHRVLQEAADTRVPLYERMKFLAIFSSNLDEFFRVRYPVIIAFSKLDKKTIKKESLPGEEAVAEKVQDTIHEFLDEFGNILVNSIIPLLRAKNIFFYYDQFLLPEHYAEVKEIFLSKVLSFIQPIFLDADTPLNFLPENNQLYFVVTVKDLLKETISQVIINIPSKKLQRFYVLQSADDIHHVIFIDDIIRDNMSMIFPGQEIKSIYSIKFNRDAELKLDDGYNAHLLDKLEKQLSKRDTANTSRFLFQKGMPANLRLFLASLFKINFSDMFEGGRYHNLSDLAVFPPFDRTMHYRTMRPVLYPPSSAGGDIFTVISQKDVLLHLPYNSYTPVLSFFNQAAVDADVKEIYITLYRVAAESHIVNALISAAKNGKKVIAFIELKARFDEANNIKWSRVMKRAGVKLIYSDAGIKVHSKIALVKKNVGDKLVAYAILSTGNFNESTAAFYTDHVLLTANKAISRELQYLFDFLQKKNPAVDKAKIKFNELLVSQFNLLNEFEKLIDLEIEKAKSGQPALIRIKVNNLEEHNFIMLLYKASQEGVTINLIVRSICCLVPGLADLSDNITVTRIVDKYLEHTRIFIFGAGDDAEIVIGSADLMTRNLYRRIEVCLRIKDTNCRNQLLKYFFLQWQDNTKATRMLNSGQQVRVGGDAIEHCAQEEIANYVHGLEL